MRAKGKCLEQTPVLAGLGGRGGNTVRFEEILGKGENFLEKANIWSAAEKEKEENIWRRRLFGQCTMCIVHFG